MSTAANPAGSGTSQRGRVLRLPREVAVRGCRLDVGAPRMEHRPDRPSTGGSKTRRPQPVGIAEVTPHRHGCALRPCPPPSGRYICSASSHSSKRTSRRSASIRPACTYHHYSAPPHARRHRTSVALQRTIPGGLRHRNCKYIQGCRWSYCPFRPNRDPFPPSRQKQARRMGRPRLKPHPERMGHRPQKPPSSPTERVGD